MIFAVATDTSDGLRMTQLPAAIAPSTGAIVNWRG